MDIPRSDWVWVQDIIFVTDDGEALYIPTSFHSPPFFSSPSEAADFFRGYTVTLTAPKPGYLYVGIGDSYCQDNIGIVYSKIIPAQPYPSSITIESRRACSWVRNEKEYKLGLIFPFSPGRYKLIIEGGGYKNSGIGMFEVFSEFINSGHSALHLFELLKINYVLSQGKWRWFVRTVIDGTGESFDLGGEIDFESFDDMISYWKGKFIIIDVPSSCNGVWFYIPDDWCDDNAGKMVINVEKLW